MLHICFHVIYIIHSDLNGDSLEEAIVVIQVSVNLDQNNHVDGEETDSRSN